jgi:nickel/cobalt transporter (NiCoT) family protein
MEDFIHAKASRRYRMKNALTVREWGVMGLMGGFIAALHILGWAILLFAVPHHYRTGAGAFGIGTGITAYTLGMRHAFDADHIAAIDNTTRKMMSEGKRPLSVGLWFSLGHSTVVFGMVFLLAMGMKSIGSQITSGNSAMKNTGGLIGTAVSGGFLYLIGIINLVILVGIVKMFRRMRHGEYDEASLEDHLNKRGFMNRLLGRVMRAIRKPWHIYPVGVLFGLGFDTTTEVAFLFLAGSSAIYGLPWYVILSLPILFAAGMSLLDTVDGSFMNFAYGWAFSKPVRKVYYNITITGLSVAVAVLIGTVELFQILQSRFHLQGAFWAWISGCNLNTIGYVIVGMFILIWGVALTVWKFGKIEQRWSANLAVSEGMTTAVFSDFLTSSSSVHDWPFCWAGGDDAGRVFRRRVAEADVKLIVVHGKDEGLPAPSGDGQ